MACIIEDLASSICGRPVINWSQTLMVGSVTMPGISHAHWTPDVTLTSEMTEELRPKSERTSLRVSNAVSQKAQLSPV